MSASSNEAPGAVVLGSLGGPDAANWKGSTARGVAASLALADSRSGSSGAFLTMTNGGQVERRAAWACYRKQFKPALDLKEHQALGLWIEGDGLGEVLGKVSPSGTIPSLRTGQNQVQFTCASGNGPSARVKVTVFTQGKAL